MPPSKLNRSEIVHEAVARMQFSVQALIIGWGGYAFGPNASSFDGVVTLETAFDEALDVVVAGWEQRLTPRAP